MKKTLTKDITRYDDRMKLKFDLKTFRAIGIGLGLAIPTFLITNRLVGSIQALLTSLMVLCGVVLILVGTIQGMTVWGYLTSILKQAFNPRRYQKPYSHEDGGYRIVVLTDEELRKERGALEDAETRKKGRHQKP